MIARHNRLRGGAAAPPLFFAALIGIAAAVTWAAASVLLVREIPTLPAPTTVGHGSPVSVAFGKNWTSYLVSQWWGDSCTLDFGRTGAVVTDSAGRPVWAPHPGRAEYAWLLARAESLGPRVMVDHRAAGWPLRVWSETAYRVGDSTQITREHRLHVLATGISLVLVGGAGFGASALPLYAAVLLRARVRRTQGLCPRCGYDVRGIAGRCPECGAGFA